MQKSDVLPWLRPSLATVALMVTLLTPLSLRAQVTQSPVDSDSGALDKRSREANTDVGTAGADGVPAAQLGPVVVSARRRSTDSNVMPDRTAVDALFGPSRSVLDTPRSVTPITQKLLDTAGVQDLRDLSRVTSDTFTPDTFGAPSLPTIRGQEGEVFQDGLRRQGGNNGFGLPLSFNGIEQVDVVKGPAPVILGATQRVGGHVDLISKRPDLFQSGGFVEGSAGSWDKYDGQLDYSQPIDPGHSAIRVSLEGRHEGSFYRYGHYISQDYYAAYQWKPDDRSLLNVNVEYFSVDFKDIAGLNRATQDLISRGIYITGQGVQPAGGPQPGSTVPGPGSVISPTGTVRIDRANVLDDPRDIDVDETVLAHAQYDYRIADNIHFTNRLYYQHLRRNEVANDSFVEIIKGADSFESRSEFVFDYPVKLLGLDTHNQSDTGVDWRLNSVLGYSQFDTEADNPVDLTGPLSNRRIPLTAAQQSQLVLLRPGVYVSPGAQYPANSGNYLISDTNDTTSNQVGLFYQHDIKLTPQWSVIGGIRGDFFLVHAQDPIPPPGQIAASDSISRFLKSYNGAIVYKPLPSISTYVATSFSQSTNNALGGGTTLGADNKIDATNFATDSRFYEAGVKYGPQDGNWYADLSVFQQTRADRNRDGSTSGIKASGVDFDAFWQPRDRLFFNLSASYLDDHYDHSAASQDTRQVSDAFDCSRPDIICGSGIGSPSYTAFPAGDEPVPGVPRITAAALASYELPFGLGGSISGVYTGQYRLDYLATVTIPDQFTLNASLFYKVRAIDTEFRLDGYNITNQDHYAPVFGSYFGATDVIPLPPASFVFSIRHRFG